jgi:hypothetical protein
VDEKGSGARLLLLAAADEPCFGGCAGADGFLAAAAADAADVLAFASERLIAAIAAWPDADSCCWPDCADDGAPLAAWLPALALPAARCAQLCVFGKRCVGQKWCLQLGQAMGE